MQILSDVIFFFYSSLANFIIAYQNQFIINEWHMEILVFNLI